MDDCVANRFSNRTGSWALSDSPKAAWDAVLLFDGLNRCSFQEEENKKPNGLQCLKCAVLLILYDFVYLLIFTVLEKSHSKTRGQAGKEPTGGVRSEQ